jgi:hypothetical protein
MTMNTTSKQPWRGRLGAAAAGLAGALSAAYGCSGTQSTATSERRDASVPDAEAVYDAPASDVAMGAVTDAMLQAVGVPPTISNLTVTPNPNSVLSATLSFTTNVPTTSKVLVTNTGDGGAANTFTIGPSTSLVTSHTIPILGMRASSQFRIDVTASDAGAQTAMGSATFSTPALPAVIPPITIATNDSSKTSPGFTLMTLWPWTGSPAAGVSPAGSSIVALDAEGQVVWYYVPASKPRVFLPTGPKKLANGDIVFVTGNNGWAEIDMLGNVVRSYAAASMGLESMHHEVTPEANGAEYLGLSTELRDVSGYPGLVGTATYPVVGDVAVEFDADGGVHGRWSAFDMLDPKRVGNSTLFNTPFWNMQYPDAGATKDWTHGNSIIEDPRDGTIIVSSRTQSWVYKFARGDGGAPQLLWKLGEGGDFTLTNQDETFQYGQHALSILASGNLMMFDDGNARPAVGGGVSTSFSRAIEYSLDTTKMTATIAWQYRETPSFYSQFLGSAYQLPNGNVLICDGGEVAGAALTGITPDNPGALKTARIMEVTHDATPTKVLEYDVNVGVGSMLSDPTFSGYSVYRAIRIPSLY